MSRDIRSQQAISPQLTEVKEEYTRLCKIRDNNWVTPEPTKTRAKTPRKGI